MAVGAGVAIGLTALNALSNAGNMVFNATESQKARDWQERMSNTAYQRTVADMKKAGLNPLLAYGNAIPPTPTASTGATVQGGASLGDTVSSFNINSAKNAVSQARLNVDKAYLELEQQKFLLNNAREAYRDTRIGFGR